MASSHYQLGLAQVYSGKLVEAEANFQSAIRILEARSINIAKLEQSDSVAMEKIDLETCIQEIKEVIVDQKDMHKQIATGLLALISFIFTLALAKYLVCSHEASIKLLCLNPLVEWQSLRHSRSQADDEDGDDARVHDVRQADRDCHCGVRIDLGTALSN